AEEGKRAYGRTIPAGFSHKRLVTLRHPVGVCAAVSPWNFPLMLQARKIAPALAAGCGVVCRPASQTPLCLLQLFELIEAEGDFPPGIVNLVTGPADEIAGEFMNNPVCRKLSFTGSTAVGKELIRQSAAQVKNLSLELGGHAPTLVLPDADLEMAARASVMGKFRNNGQVCICPTRVFVHEKIYDPFVEACVEETRRLRLGNGLDPETHIGPMFELPALVKAVDLVAEALDKGARCVLGGDRASGFDKGYFYQPTILTNMQESMRMMQEEPFSPVMPILKFTDLDEVLVRANATRYGLAAYIMTRDLNAACRLAEGLEFGIIGINDTVPGTPQAPFGGLKESGLGREGGPEGLDAYLETKYVSIGLDP
ncbi:MAG: NAD-dependent succinate-semialdehyde dehydrogenase, partial [Verrucomicrobiota bacterium]